MAVNRVELCISYGFVIPLTNILTPLPPSLLGYACKHCVELTSVPLEGIITASIRNDLPPNVADIISTLPESDRWRFTSSGQQRKKVKSVESGPERVNTGLFNSIDNSTMANIMGYLPSKDCHTGKLLELL